MQGTVLILEREKKKKKKKKKKRPANTGKASMRQPSAIMRSSETALKVVAAPERAPIAAIARTVIRILAIQVALQLGM
ncbi:MAG: hypothetical protein ABL883_06465 [Terricaulis sp.]